MSFSKRHPQLAMQGILSNHKARALLAPTGDGEVLPAAARPGHGPRAPPHPGGYWAGAVRCAAWRRFEKPRGNLIHPEMKEVVQVRPLHHSRGTCRERRADIAKLRVLRPEIREREPKAIWIDARVEKLLNGSHYVFLYVWLDRYSQQARCHARIEAGTIRVFAPATCHVQTLKRHVRKTTVEEQEKGSTSRRP